MTGEMTLSVSSGAMLLLLGAFHGINPGMGWLFAVALGMQERRRAAVCRALLPLGAGHALAVVAAVALALAAGAVIPIRDLRWVVGGVLLVLGVSRLFRHRHPGWARMRVGFLGLTMWSFLMGSAHGAGLMVAPVFLRMAAVDAQPACHAVKASGAAAAVLASGLHAMGYLLVTAIVALAVFEKLGVGMLRKAWLNLDFIWAVALIGTGILTVSL